MNFRNGLIVAGIIVFVVVSGFIAYQMLGGGFGSGGVERPADTAEETPALPEPEARWESAFSYPYPFSATVSNGAVISLTKASLLAYATSSALVLDFKTNTAYGGFCASSFSTILRRLANEMGDMVPPGGDFSKDNCIGPNTTIESQIIKFDVPQSELEFIIFVFGDGGKQDFFTVKALNGGSIKIEPAPKSG